MKGKSVNIENKFKKCRWSICNWIAELLSWSKIAKMSKKNINKNFTNKRKIWNKFMNLDAKTIVMSISWWNIPTNWKNTKKYCLIAIFSLKKKLTITYNQSEISNKWLKKSQIDITNFNLNMKNFINSYTIQMKKLSFSANNSFL